MDRANEIELYAKLTSLEFFIECLFAQHLAMMPLDFQEQSISEMRRLAKNAYSNDAQSDSDFLLHLANRSSEMSNKLLEKIEGRASQIRASVE